MEDSDLAYLAGILDGEGCLRIEKNSRAPSSFSPAMAVVNTNPILINWLKQNFGGSTNPEKHNNSNWKVSYRWRLGGVEAIELLRLVRPFIKLKVPQAEQLFAFWELHESWGVVGGAPSHWGYAASAGVMFEAMKILNQKGTNMQAKNLTTEGR